MKRMTLFTALITFALAAPAQHLTGGLKAGANITNFTGGNFNNLDKKALVGFHAGLFVNYRLGAFSIQPEALVSTAGATFKNADSSFRVTYVSVPVMLKYRSEGGFYVEVGPQVSFKISEDVGSQTVGDFAKNLDLSAAGGLGFQTKGGLGIGARYLVGLTKVGNFKAIGNADPDFRNSIIQVGISFPLGK